MPHDINNLAHNILASPILLVDDNEINRIFLEKTLRARGFTHLMTVASAEEALEKMDEFHPDMVLLDILMPDGMDGFECCQAIRKQKKYQDLPILIQTSITEPELRVKAFKKGATDFVSKPLFPDELSARVMVHLEKRHSMRTLQMYKNRIEAELESAKQLQLAILPGTHEIQDIEGRSRLDIAAYFEPSSEIGGDFWGLRHLFPHQTALWLVDFSGHGVSAALNAFRLQAYLKESSPMSARPGEYLSILNDKLLNLLLRGQFATMFYGIVDTQSNQIFYACASTAHPLLLSKKTGAVEVIDGTGNPLGVGMHLYPTQITSFAAGDKLVLYSDALIETPNPAGDYIAEEDIMKLMERHPQASSEALKEIILGYFRQHAGNTLRDDLTILICSRL